MKEGNKNENCKINDWQGISQSKTKYIMRVEKQQYSTRKWESGKYELIGTRVTYKHSWTKIKQSGKLTTNLFSLNLLLKRDEQSVAKGYPEIETNEQ